MTGKTNQTPVALIATVPEPQLGRVLTMLKRMKEGLLGHEINAVPGVKTSSIFSVLLEQSHYVFPFCEMPMVKAKWKYLFRTTQRRRLFDRRTIHGWTHAGCAGIDTTHWTHMSNFTMYAGGKTNAALRYASITYTLWHSNLRHVVSRRESHLFDGSFIVSATAWAPHDKCSFQSDKSSLRETRTRLE